MKAQNKEEFIESWERVANELAGLHHTANIETMEEISKVTFS